MWARERTAGPGLDNRKKTLRLGRDGHAFFPLQHAFALMALPRRDRRPPRRRIGSGWRGQGVPGSLSSSILHGARAGTLPLLICSSLLCLGLAMLESSMRAPGPVLVMEPGLLGSISSLGNDSSGSISEGQRPDPLDFTPEELRELNRRFGVHGPQPRLAQLFTEGLDQFQPLRNHTLARIEQLRPVILRESLQHNINPMLVTAILFDEMQHAKPGEHIPLAAHSGLFSTHGPAQLSLSELVKQGLLSADASPEEEIAARDRLLDPDGSVAVLVGKFVRLRRELELPDNRILNASGSPRDAKALATLAYLHNGKLDYPGRILRYMQDPALHAVIFAKRQAAMSALI
jgi:hypothetical protein